jgi:DNA-binding transcriptional regulator YiaG
MALQFRNVDVDPSSPVSEWPYEALVTALERGVLSDWRRIAAEIDSRPWGRVARRAEAYLSYERPYGVAPLMDDVIARARRRREAEEKSRVASMVREAVERSGLSRTEFAAAIGTSASRLSTYCSGKVTPSAGMLLRILDQTPNGAAAASIQ